MPASQAARKTPLRVTVLPDTLPLLQYTSLLGTQILLLLFTALFLPRTTVLVLPSALPSQKSSLDRPQHPFIQPLTASPEWTLAWICLGTAVIISWWAGWVKVWHFEEHRAVDESPEAARQKKLMMSSKGRSMLAAWSSTFGFALVMFVALLFFGAPLNSHHIATSLLALLLSILTIYTPSYTIPLPLSIFSQAKSQKLASSSDVLQWHDWVRMFCEVSLKTPLERIFAYPAIGALVGCWLGAFVLPLDWDRPWQAWPLIPAYGAIIGYILGSVSSLAVNTVHFLADTHRAEEAQKSK